MKEHEFKTVDIKIFAVKSPDIYDIIFMFNYYSELAKSCWTLYGDILDAYLCYDHYMIYVQHYERLILQELA